MSMNDNSTLNALRAKTWGFNDEGTDGSPFTSPLSSPFNPPDVDKTKLVDMSDSLLDQVLCDLEMNIDEPLQLNRTSVISDVGPNSKSLPSYHRLHIRKAIQRRDVIEHIVVFLISEVCKFRQFIP